MPNVLYHHLLLPILLLSAVLAAAYDGAAILKIASSFRPAPGGWSSTSSAHYCTWPGITCDKSSRVTAINLFDKGLSGTLAPEISSLSELRTLALQRNHLSGTVPSFANHSNLRSIYLDKNDFTEVAPGAFSGLTSLETLSMTDNRKLSPWTFPDLSETSSLIELQLGNASLYGTLPDTFGIWINLTSLRLSYNNLSGTLPASLGDSTIQNFWINNQDGGFTGTIEVLSNMEQLSQVWLFKNMFTGPIPDLSKCQSIFDLQLRDNQLTGPVPESLINLPNLKNVSLANNKLQGPFPKFPISVEKVAVDGTNNYCSTISIGDHCDPQVATMLEIAGGFGYPVFLSDDWAGNNACKWSFVTCLQGTVITVNLAKKDLTGVISPAFGNLTALKNLNLNDNRLTGSIPDSLTKLSSLQVLDVYNNNLTGDIPTFSSSVKFTYTGNSLLGKSSGSGGESSNSGSSNGDTDGPRPSNKSNTWLKAVLGVAAGFAAIVILSIAIIFGIRREYLSTKVILLLGFWRKKGESNDQNVMAFIRKYGSLAPKQFSHSDIKKMTNSFQHKVGQGGFGTVYKGKRVDGSLVAVKILSESKSNNGEEFINEVASIGRTSHVNIVSLLGFCYQGRKRALVYEYMPNGSLDKFIYDQGTRRHVRLECTTLYKIAVGIARGLEYLHRGCGTRIVHFDIKPQNILLDEDFCPKISDFGLAKLCRKKESVVSMMGARGTLGYIAPEVFCRNYGGVSHKSDVYSYGMMVLEMVVGKEKPGAAASNASEIYFPDWIYTDLEQGIDFSPDEEQMIIEELDRELKRKMILVGLWCIQTNPSDRPSINKVIEMLEGSIHCIQVPPKPFLFSPTRSPSILVDPDIESSGNENTLENRSDASQIVNVRVILN